MSDYSFRPYLDALPDNWYEDDPLLGRLLRRYRGRGGNEAALRRWGARVAGELRELAEVSARPENRPRLRHLDGYGRRVDEVVLPDSTLRSLAVTEGEERLGAVHGDPFDFYARVYLYAQNGEAGVACSLACTDGLVRVLEALGDRPEHRRAVERVRGSTPDRVVHGAQFVTEIQGGSDVPANELVAEPDGDGYRLYGQKWFCSNINADHFVVTARPRGAPGGGRGVGLFLVSAHGKDAETSKGRTRGGLLPRRNGYTIDRLKEKLGTRELATAEVTFDGAWAVPIGPSERGIPNLVEHVLAPSRFACCLAAAAFLRRAERIVTTYTGFRTAFGSRLVEYPLVSSAAEEIRTARRRATAMVFELLRLWEAARGGGAEAALDFRVMLSLCKPVLTRRATRGLHEAMMLLGGNGIEEEFSPLPRLYRDAAIMETWEGPHNVLLTQALRDLARFEVEPAAFVGRVAGEAAGDGPAAGAAVAAGGPAGELGELLDRAEDPRTTVPFAGFAKRLVHAAADRVLEETTG